MKAGKPCKVKVEQPGSYQPIVLDQAIWQQLQLDPLAYSLTAELEKEPARCSPVPVMATV